MIKLLFAVLCLNLCFAQEITNWNSTIDFDQEDLLDHIYDDASEKFFVGDDGESCEGNIEDVMLTSFSGGQDITEFTVTYSAYVEGSFYCINYYNIFCTATYTKVSPPKKYFPKNWDYKIDCDFEW